jgi:hypothetical protein
MTKHMTRKEWLAARLELLSGCPLYRRPSLLSSSREFPESTVQSRWKRRNES